MIEQTSGLKFVQSQRDSIHKISELIGSNSSNIRERIVELIEHNGQLVKRLKKFEEERRLQQVITLIEQADVLGSINFVTYVSNTEDVGAPTSSVLLT